MSDWHDCAVREFGVDEVRHVGPDNGFVVLNNKMEKPLQYKDVEAFARDEPEESYEDEALAQHLADGRAKLNNKIKGYHTEVREHPVFGQILQSVPDYKQGCNLGMNSTESLLAERATTHGDFHDHCFTVDALLGVCEGTPKWNELSITQEHGLYMILHKIARALCGTPGFADHWDDIAGYAKLVSKSINKGINPL